MLEAKCDGSVYRARTYRQHTYAKRIVSLTRSCLSMDSLSSLTRSPSYSLHLRLKLHGMSFALHCSTCVHLKLCTLVAYSHEWLQDRQRHLAGVDGCGERWHDHD